MTGDTLPIPMTGMSEAAEHERRRDRYRARADGAREPLKAFFAWRASRCERRRLEALLQSYSDGSQQEDMEAKWAKLGVDLSQEALPADATSASDREAPRPAQSEDAIEQLERLAALRKAGVLSKAEFAAKKAQLLRRI